MKYRFSCSTGPPLYTLKSDSISGIRSLKINSVGSPSEEYEFAIEHLGKEIRARDVLNEGEMIDVDRLADEEGAKIELDRVLMVVDGETYTVGTPEVDGVKVKATVDKHFKGPKLIVFKYHPKKRYRLKKGHRQQYTRLAIEKIG